MVRKIAFLAMVIVVTLGVAYIYHLQAQLQEQKALAERYKEKAEGLSGITRTDAKKVNDAFIQRFFNYKNTAERYNISKDIMTKQGFHAIHPSSEKVPEKGADITASISHVRSYEHAESRTQVEYINTFIQTITFNGESTNNTVMVKTKLIFIDNQWKVDDLENIPIEGQQMKPPSFLLGEHFQIQ